MSRPDDEIIEKHPAYATIRITRTQGSNARLFGSPIRSHQHTIRISVAAAERIHSLGHDRYYEHGGMPIMQVEMTAAQFAELITTVNSDSVPCTLRVRDRVRVENPPDDVKVEADLVREKFAADVKDALTKLRPAMTAVEDVLAKKSLTNADRVAARHGLEQFERLISDMAPFMLDQFEEATQRITTAAKIEVDAFMTSVIVAAGLKAINEHGLDAVPPEMRPALPAPQETP